MPDYSIPSIKGDETFFADENLMKKSCRYNSDAVSSQNDVVDVVMERII